jgi:hypothetical protein
LNLVNDLSKGNAAGVAMDILAIAYPPAAAVLMVVNIINSLFGGNSPPQPYGSGQIAFNADGSVGVNATGANGGQAIVQNQLQGLLNALQSIMAEVQANSPQMPLGLVANRMPGLSFNGSGYTLTDIDPVTGQDRSITYNTQGQVTGGVAVGSPEYFRTLGQQFVYTAQAREAIAPKWEVDTARLMQAAGNPQAGLREGGTASNRYQTRSCLWAASAENEHKWLTNLAANDLDWRKAA